jgi:hypothetical protein
VDRLFGRFARFLNYADARGRTSLQACGYS